MAGALLLMVIFGLGFYLFGCLVQFKICEKFGIGTLFECCIPIYNMVLLCRCADISGWNVLWLIIPGIFLATPLAFLSAIITCIFNVVLWGKIAERMGRSYWQYGLGCTFLLGIPILVLAFGAASPSSASISYPVRKNDEFVAPEPVYKPLPLNDPYVSPSPVFVGSSSLGIYCCTGELRGNTIPVNAGGLTIGRDPSRCQIVLSSNDASRAHTSVVPDRNDSSAMVVTDLQSTNGTFRQAPGSSSQSFKWERIVGSAVLKQGNKFRIGKDVAEFEVR